MWYEHNIKCPIQTVQKFTKKKKLKQNLKHTACQQKKTAVKSQNPAHKTRRNVTTCCSFHILQAIQN